MGNIYHHLSHNIASVSSGDLQTSNADIKPLNIFEASLGATFAEISANVTAPLAEDAQIVLTVYTEEDLSEFHEDDPVNQFINGIDIVSPVIVAAGESKKFRLKSLYVGPSRFAICLKSCPDGTAVKIAARRFSDSIVNQ